MAAATRAAGSRSPSSSTPPGRRRGPGADARSGTALVGRQPDVAARQGQPVDLAHRRAGHDRRPAATGRPPSAGPRPAAGSPSRRSRPGTARPGRRAWPPPWPPRRSAPAATPPRGRRSTPSTWTVVATGARKAGYISCTGGANTIVAPAARRPGHVGVEVARVGGEILGLVELQRVDEDRHGHDVALGRRPLDQRPVPGVQGAHGGDEARPVRPDGPRSASRASENSPAPTVDHPHRDQLRPAPPTRPGGDHRSSRRAVTAPGGVAPAARGQPAGQGHAGVVAGDAPRGRGRRGAGPGWPRRPGPRDR